MSARKRHPASLARIATTGLAATTTFAIVGGLALDRAHAGDPKPTLVPADPNGSPTAPAPRQVIIIHRRAAADPTPAPASGAPAIPPAAGAPVAAAPQATVPAATATAPAPAATAAPAPPPTAAPTTAAPAPPPTAPPTTIHSSTGGS